MKKGSETIAREYKVKISKDEREKILKMTLEEAQTFAHKSGMAVGDLLTTILTTNAYIKE